MRVPGRFAWKMLGAMLLVAALAAGMAGYALDFMLRRLGAFAVEHQARTGTALAQAVEVWRAQFADQKEDFRRRTVALAATRPAQMAALAGTEDLVRARLLDGRTVTDSWEAPADGLARFVEAPAVVAAIPRGAGDGPGPERVLELTFGLPRATYDNFLALQEAINEERDLDRAYDAYVPRFLRGFLVPAAAILLVAPIVGLFVARRVTRRVARLHAAALRVGEGDLTVKVEPTGRDELDDLGRAFDRMVSELADARSRLEYLQKVSAWQEVARRLAHEIKNPLTPIQLAVQELASQYRGGDPAYERLLGTAREILHEEITSLRRLVDDFSAFAKLPKVEPASMDLGVLVTETLRLHPEWQPFVRAAVNDGVCALCDRMLFTRVLANLIENASQAARGAGREPQVRITVEARRDRGRAAVIVDDNGPGVPEAERQRIFDPYVTHREGGTGLGLAIVRKIVIDLGGDVTVTAAPPPFAGARLVVELPLG